MAGTVVLLPSAQLPGAPVGTWAGRLEIAAELAAYSIPVFLPKDPGPLDPSADRKAAAAHWVAHNAVQIAGAGLAMPLLLAANGPAGGLLQALGFSQKASRHSVSGYVLIDAELPNPKAGDWPDAPVDVVTTPRASRAALDAARIADLRGWTCHRDADAAQLLRKLAED